MDGKHCVICGDAVASVGGGVVDDGDFVSTAVPLCFSGAPVANFLVRCNVFERCGMPDNVFSLGDTFLCRPCFDTVVKCDEWNHLFLDTMDDLKKKAAMNPHRLVVACGSAAPKVERVVDDSDSDTHFMDHMPVLSPQLMLKSDIDDLFSTASGKDPLENVCPSRFLDPPAINLDEIRPFEQPAPVDEKPEPKKSGRRTRNRGDTTAGKRKNAEEDTATAKKKRKKRKLSPKAKTEEDSADEEEKPGAKSPKRAKPFPIPKMCAICAVPTANLNYQDHFREAHPGMPFKRAVFMEPFRCSVCKYTSRVKDLIRRHEAAKHGIGETPTRIPCPDCGQKFTHIDRVRVHQHKAHGHPKAYKCDECGHELNSPYGLKYHKLHKHPAKIEKTICAHCGEEVLSHYYDSHLKHKHFKTPPKPYPCQHCDVVMKSWRGLQSHLTNSHGIGNYERPSFEGVCPDCGKRVKTREYYYAHMFEKHGKELQGLKKRPCPHCDEVFCVKAVFKAHVMMHTGEKEYFCTECSYSTRFSGNMTKHRANVHGKKKTQTE